MENASKALIMAGSILIALIIISMSIWVLNKFKDTATKAVDMTEQEIAAFNSKITPYTGSATTGSQVNALLQYCLSVNMQAKKSNESFKIINVYLDGSSIIDADSTTYERVETSSYYSVNPTYNNGLITIINITKN